MKYPLSDPSSMSLAAVSAAMDSLRSGRYTMGLHVETFEQQIAAYVGATHAVMVNSGSSANLIAVEALMRPSSGEPVWKAGDEILVPALAWPTTVWPLVQLGLLPVFVDVEPDTFAINWRHAEHMLSARTRGVMLIHVLGCPANMAAADTFCLAHDLTLVEDACEAFGSRWCGRHVGTFGTIGTFSHFFSHQLTTMEGGTVVTDDDAIADDLRSIRAHGWTRNRTDRAFFEAKANIDPRFLFVTTGYNVRPLDLQGAAGLAQLTDVDHRLYERKVTAQMVGSLLATVPWLRLPSVPDVAWMNFPVLVSLASPLTAPQVMAIFEQHGVETRPILSGNLLQHPAMARVAHRADPAGYPVADRVMRDGFMIGCHSNPELAAGCVRAACAALKQAA